MTRDLKKCLICHIKNKLRYYIWNSGSSVLDNKIYVYCKECVYRLENTPNYINVPTSANVTEITYKEAVVCECMNE
jgi:hypothetical protein